MKILLCHMLTLFSHVVDPFLNMGDQHANVPGNMMGNGSVKTYGTQMQEDQITRHGK